jgi:SAM-dependent methyltransferase
MSGGWRAGPVAASGSPPHPADTHIPTPPARDTRVIWHDIECGAYSADLTLWEELAAGGVLDLGCGTGRVATHLARCGHAVIGLDREPAFVAAFNERAAQLPAHALTGDARNFALDSFFDLILAPMQLIQLLAGPEEREGCLRCVAAHLRPGGLAAFAIVERVPAPVAGPPPLPDTREVDGWVYSSLPIEAGIDADGLRARRLRQTVSPDGDLTEELDEILLALLDAPTLEREAAAAGLTPAGRRTVPPTSDHVGSSVVLLEGPA